MRPLKKFFFFFNTLGKEGMNQTNELSLSKEYF